MSKIKCFIAGAKALVLQRQTLLSELMSLQNKWNVKIEGKSFEDFPSTLAVDGRQCDYEAYVSGESDIFVCIVEAGLGNITLTEFMVAYTSFVKNNRPDIIVFIKDGPTSKDVETFKNTLSRLGQYYVEYSDLYELKEIFSNEIDKYILARPELIKNIDTNEEDTSSPRERASKAAYLAKLCYFIDLARLSGKSVSESIMADFKQALLFWNIQIDVANVSGSVGDMLCKKIEESEKEFATILKFCYEYYTLAYAKLAGDKISSAKMEDACRETMKYGNIPELLMKKLPKKDQFDKYQACINFPIEVFQNYTNYVVACKKCGKRFVNTKDVCPHCGTPKQN